MDTKANTSTTYRELTGDVTTIIELTSLGQCPPDESDNVQVQATLKLPTEPGSWRLLGALQFGARCYVLGEGLKESWGVVIAEGWRSKSLVESAPTYREARERALAAARRATAGIHKHLRIRAEALAAAGEP